MKLSTKITFGFAAVVAVTAVLGIVAQISMRSASSAADVMAEAYLPEVQVSARIESNATSAMFDLRGYGFTSDEKFLRLGRGFLEEVGKALDDAEQLAEAHSLPALAQTVEEARSALVAYQGEVETTVGINRSMDTKRGEMDAAAGTYMTALHGFVTGQETALERDLSERQTKIGLVVQIIDNAAEARVSNFKSQATGDLGTLDEAIARIDKIDGLADLLGSVTRREVDLQRIDEIVAAANAYQDAMKAFRQGLVQNLADDSPVIRNARREMDASAGIMMQQCRDFLDGQSKALSTDINERIEKIRLAETVQRLGNEARGANFKAQALRDSAILEEGLTNFSKITQQYEALRKITRLPEDLALIAQTEEAGQAYETAMQGFLADWKRLQVLNKQRVVTSSKMVDAAQKSATAAMEHLTSKTSDVTDTLGTGSTVILVGLLLAIVASVVLAFFIVRSISQAVREVANDLRDASTQVTSAANQVSSGAQDMANGASEQAAGIEETSSSLEELSSMTHQNSENAGQANTLMSENSKLVEEVNQSMGELTRQMAEISEASGEMQKIIKTIDEIAFQTNLLALNAAVEAARAGEAGAGFAVVADEVRNLAMRAAEAAKNTSSLIESSVEKIGSGSEIVERTNEVFIRVEEGSRQAVELVEQISNASREQASGLDQINKAIADMDKVTQHTASGAEESASAAQELATQADKMYSFVKLLVQMVDGQGGLRGMQPASGGSFGGGSAPQRFAAQPAQKEVAVPSGGGGSGHDGFFLTDDQPGDDGFDPLTR
ncbi:MAG: methyl-accepting chemotaxis protein [Opitutales bacterium]